MDNNYLISVLDGDKYTYLLSSIRFNRTEYQNMDVKIIVLTNI
jgi:hypothetical protein